MNKHTPGPWIRDKYGAMIDSKGESIILRGVSTLCSGSDDRIEMAEANTDLACSAPDLLAALIDARDVISVALRSSAPDWFKDEEDVASHVTVSRIDRAIAKSRGES